MSLRPVLPFLLGLGLAQAQSQSAFEVASIKPAAELNAAAVMGGKARLGTTIDAGRAEFRFLSLSDLVQYAYQVKAYQVTGPDWIRTQRFDIVAKLPDGATRDQVPAMLQSLLAERFKLAFRRDHAEHAVYGLVVAKGGLKLNETSPDPPPAPGESNMRVEKAGGSMVVGGGGGAVRAPGMGLHIERKMTLATLADFLSRFVDRPIVDMTETKGTYDIALDIPLADVLRSSGAVVTVSHAGSTLDAGAARAITDHMAEDADAPSLFTAVQKLGLKLEPRKAPMEVLAVESAEKSPLEN